jgi:hypothetical protein
MTTNYYSRIHSTSTVRISRIWTKERRDHLRLARSSGARPQSRLRPSSIISPRNLNAAKECTTTHRRRSSSWIPARIQPAGLRITSAQVWMLVGVRWSRDYGSTCVLSRTLSAPRLLIRHHLEAVVYYSLLLCNLHTDRLRQAARGVCFQGRHR